MNGSLRMIGRISPQTDGSSTVQMECGDLYWSVVTSSPWTSDTGNWNSTQPGRRQYNGSNKLMGRRNEGQWGFDGGWG